MRRTIRNAAVILLAVGSACAVTTSVATPASSSTTDVLQFSGTITDFTTIPNRGPDEPQQAGDQAFFVTQLSRGGKVVGSAPHHCTAVNVDYSLCEAALDLPGGEITLQAALGGRNAGTPIDFAITGGTGQFRHAHGTVTVRSNPDGSVTLVVDLG